MRLKKQHLFLVLALFGTFVCAAAVFSTPEISESVSEESAIYLPSIQSPASPWQEVGVDSAFRGGISNTAGHVSTTPSMAIKPDGTPYIAWAEEGIERGFSNVYVRIWNGETWEEAGEGAASGGGISKNTSFHPDPSLAVTPYGAVIVAWQVNGHIYALWRNEGDWIEVSPGSASGDGIGGGTSPLVAVAPDGIPYVASFAITGIHVRRWTGGYWEDIGFLPTFWGPHSLAIAPTGIPYVAWHDWFLNSFDIYILRWNGSSWEEVGTRSASNGGISKNSGNSVNPSLAIAPDGTPYVAWSDDSSGYAEIYVSRWNGLTWEEVGAGSASGGGISNSRRFSEKPSLAIAPDGTPYVAWSTGNIGIQQIYVRRWNGSSWEEVGLGSASGGGVSMSSKGAYFPSLAITPDGTPYVTWADNSYGIGEIYVRRWVSDSP